MNPNHEVISDFLDDEAFEPRALGEALADPAGRELLIDFIVLRYAAQSDDDVIVAQAPARGQWRRLLLAVAAVAAVLVALVGGYQLGHRDAAPDSRQPPAATRVIQAEWHGVTQESAQ